MFTDWSQMATILNSILVLAVIAGGILGLRSGKSKADSETMRDIIQALQAENEVLHGKIARLEQDIVSLNTQILLLQRKDSSS